MGLVSSMGNQEDFEARHDDQCGRNAAEEQTLFELGRSHQELR